MKKNLLSFKINNSFSKKKNSMALLLTQLKIQIGTSPVSIGGTGIAKRYCLASSGFNLQKRNQLFVKALKNSQTPVAASLEENPLLSNFPTSLTHEQRDLLNGTLLGDGNLQTGSQGKTWRYRAVHCEAQINYLLTKRVILADLCGPTPPFSIVEEDKRTHLVYPRKGFNTLTCDLLLPFGQAFYTFNPSLDQFEKKIPEDLATRLNARTLAWLYGCDGALKWKGHSNACRLCVEGFKPEEVIFMVDTIKKTFNIACNVEKKRKSFNIYFPEKSYPQLRELIGPYLFPELYYKFPDGKKGTFKGM